MSDDDDELVKPRGKSIAHHYMPSKMVYVSFDVEETGGEYCGIIQMSANIFRINNNDGEIERESFDRYVKSRD